MAIEDAAALGILFNKTYFGGDVAKSLEIYNQIRLPRATRVQAAAAKAAYNINERIGEFLQKAHTWEEDLTDLASPHTGFSSNTNFEGYKVEDEKNKLTVEEMNA